MRFGTPSCHAIPTYVYLNEHGSENKANAVASAQGVKFQPETERCTCYTDCSLSLFCATLTVWSDALNEKQRNNSRSKLPVKYKSERNNNLE